VKSVQPRDLLLVIEVMDLRAMTVLTAMSGVGLGRVETPSGSIGAWRRIRDDHRFLGLAALAACKASDADSGRFERFWDHVRAYVCDDYAVIAAMSDWAPIMFMPRVRL
jgi:hypothetical protein